MVSRICVEGGGNDNDALRTECRKAFSALIEKAGLAGRMPRIEVCGGRKEAFDHFCHRLSQSSETAFLLVDSESPVAGSRWDHVRNRPGDQWEKPAGATEEQLHFMAVCMETWLLSDPENLAGFYGQGFKAEKLPGHANLEAVQKTDVFRSLDAATRTSAKGGYSKGKHSFRLLESTRASALESRCAAAHAFFEALRRSSPPVLARE